MDWEVSAGDSAAMQKAYIYIEKCNANKTSNSITDQGLMLDNIQYIYEQ